MKLDEVPQDHSSTYGGHSKLVYAVDASGHYQRAQSDGWETEAFATQLGSKLSEGTYVHPTAKRQDTCFDHIDAAVGWIASKFYIDAEYAEGLYSDAVVAGNHKIVTQMRRVFRDDVISSLEWMDEPTKQVAKSKVDAISQRIGWPRFETMNRSAVLKMPRKDRPRQPPLLSGSDQAPKEHLQ